MRSQTALRPDDTPTCPSVSARWAQPWAGGTPDVRRNSATLARRRHVNDESEMRSDSSKPNRRSVAAGFASLLLAGPGLAPSRLRAEEAGATDCHAHVFKRGLKLADVRRYAPDYDATPQDYLRVLDENGMARGVLVQPSFLGTDNSSRRSAPHRAGCAALRSSSPRRRRTSSRA